MKTPSIIQLRSDGRASCTVCSSVHVEAIREALAAGHSAASVSRQFGVSTDALGRHRRAGHDAARLVAVGPNATALGCVEAALAIMRNARAASEVEYARGANRVAAQIGDSAIRALGALKDLGVDPDSIRADLAASKEVRRSASLLARSVEEFIAAHPEQAEQLALSAEAVGAHKLAADLRTEDPEAETS